MNNKFMKEDQGHGSGLQQMPKYGLKATRRRFVLPSFLWIFCDGSFPLVINPSSPYLFCVPFASKSLNLQEVLIAIIWQQAKLA